MVGCQKPWSTSDEKDKFPPIQLEAGQIWTAATSEFAIYFLQKIISRYISIYLIKETQKNNSKIQPLARNGHSCRFDRILKQA